MIESELAAATRQWMQGILAQCERRAVRGVQTRAWTIGPTSLRQYWYAQSRFATFARPLEHQAAAVGPAQLTVHCLVDEDGIALGEGPFRRSDLGNNRSIPGLSQSRMRVLWDQDNRFVQALDLQSGRGFFYVADFDLLPEWEPPIPFRNFLHWWAAAEGHVFLHAGSAGTREGGIVFLGRGGAGKSTTTLACLDAGMTTCGDDYVLVTGGKTPDVHSVYGTAKLKNGARLRPESILQRLLPTAMAVADKTLLFPAIEMPGSFANHFPLKALATLVQGGETTVIEPATPLEALRAAGPSTVLQMPFGQAEGLSAIASLARTVPSYRITLGRDLAEVGTTIASFVDRLVPASPARRTAFA